MSTVSTSRIVPRPEAIRNPACARLAPLPARRRSGAAAVLETLGFGVGIAAVAGALPFVMYLRG
jgi:hypothetical protein